MNLTYKYVENGQYTEIYDESGKLLFRDKSYIPEPEITTSTMKVKNSFKKMERKIPSYWAIFFLVGNCVE